MATFTIPQTTLPVGQTTVGPHTIPASSRFSISLDRTLPGGMNSLTAATTMDLSVDTSPDGGTTWVNEAAFTGARGGPQTGPHGVQLNADGLNITGINPNPLCRAIVVIGGPSPVVVAGSLTVS